MSAVSAAHAVIEVFKDRWSIDQEEGWEEFGPDTEEDVRLIIEAELGQ